MKNENKNKIFPVLKEGFNLQRITTGGRIYTNLNSNLKNNKQFFEVNESAGRIIELCDGKTELEEIASKISSHYNEGYQPTLSIIKSYLNENNGILIDIYTKPIKRNILITGNWKINAPTQVSVELTYKCNFFCRHCYIDSGPERKEFADSKKLIQVLNSLSADYAVSVIEISGGEPTLHPDFLDIVKYCAEHFPFISVITNGYIINMDYIGELSKYKSNLSFQISLSGDNQEYVDWFCDKKGAFEHAKTAIKLLSKEGFKVRVAMLITPKNMNSVFNTASLAKKLGAMSFVISPIVQLGRGQLYPELSFDHVFTHRNIPKLNDIAEKLEKKFGNFVTKSPEFKESEGKDLLCGVGNAVMSITPDGNIKLCPMADSNDLTIANVYDNDLFKIFSEYPVLQVKDPKQELCGDCEYFRFCGNCLVRGLKKYKELGDKCSWGKAINLTLALEEARAIADNIKS